VPFEHKAITVRILGKGEEEKKQNKSREEWIDKQNFRKKAHVGIFAPPALCLGAHAGEFVENWEGKLFQEGAGAFFGMEIT